MRTTAECTQHRIRKWQKWWFCCTGEKKHRRRWENPTLTVCSQYRPPAAWAGRRRGRCPGRTTCPSHTHQLWAVRTEIKMEIKSKLNFKKKSKWWIIWPRNEQTNKWEAVDSSVGLTVDGRRDEDVQEFGAVAGVDQLVGTQRVEAQGAAAGLVLRLHHHHHVEAVAGEILSLGDSVKWNI